MKALFLDESNRLSLREIPEFRERKHECLIKVRLAGICRTDIELTRGYLKFTGIPGHEFVGEVLEGPEHLVGKRVVGEINAACGTCVFCLKGQERHCPYRTVLGIHHRNGAFAELLYLPENNLLKVPDAVSDEEAVFTEPLAAALEIFEQLHLEPGMRVLVIGDGKLGLLIAQVFAYYGHRVKLRGRHEKKLALARRWGVETEISSSSKERDTTLSVKVMQKYPLVIEATGNAGGFYAAIDAVRPRGTVVLKSTYAPGHEPHLNAASIVVDEITLVGSRCGRFGPALRLLAQGKLDVRCLIDHRKPLEQGLEAFELAQRPGTLKVLIQI